MKVAHFFCFSEKEEEKQNQKKEKKNFHVNIKICELILLFETPPRMTVIWNFLLNLNERARRGVFVYLLRSLSRQKNKNLFFQSSHILQHKLLSKTYQLSSDIVIVVCFFFYYLRFKKGSSSAALIDEEGWHTHAHATKINVVTLFLQQTLGVSFKQRAELGKQTRNEANQVSFPQ